MNLRTLFLLAPLLVATAPAPAQTTPGFDSIEVSGAASLRFTQGSSDQVVVEGDAETQKSVTTEVRDGQLTVRPSGSWKFWNSKRVQVNVTARDLKRLTISGAADLLAAGPVQLDKLRVNISGAGLARFDQLKADELSFNVSGAGDGQVAGSVNQLVVSISGKSSFGGENLSSQRARVSVSGIGDVKVWVLQDLSVSVSGIGTVDYWGSPNVRRNSSGIANINDRGPKAAPSPP